MAKQKLTEEMKQQLLHLRQGGKTYSELAEFLEEQHSLVRSEDSLRMLLKRASLPDAKFRSIPHTKPREERSEVLARAASNPPREEHQSIPAEVLSSSLPELQQDSPVSLTEAHSEGELAVTTQALQELLNRGGETALYLAAGIVLSFLLVHLLGSFFPAFKGWAWLGAVLLGAIVFVLVGRAAALRALALGIAAGGILQAILLYLRQAISRPAKGR